jgi:hypothetical protein
MGRPGLIGVAAQTAVIAGTATAVSGGMRRRQYNRMQEDQAAQDAEQAQQDQAMQQAAAAAVAAQTPPPAAPAAPASSPLLDQMNQLAQMHSSGILTDEEFASAKAKLLG